MREALMIPDLHALTKRAIRTWAKGLDIGTFIEKVGAHADVFLKQQVNDLVRLRPHLFRRKNGHTFKIFDLTINAANWTSF